MAHSSASLFRNLLLGVQIRSRCGKLNQLQARIFCHEFANCGAAMPFRAIPQQYNSASWVAVQDFLQLLCAHRVVQFCRTCDKFFSGVQIDRPIEANLGSSGINPNDRGLATTAQTLIVVACKYIQASSSARKMAFGSSWARSITFFRVLLQSPIHHCPGET